MKRKDHPVASPPKRSAGHATGSVPPDRRVSSPAQGKRKANVTIAHEGLRAAATASPTAISSTGSRSGAAGGNPTRNSSADPPADKRKNAIRTPVPGDRINGSSDDRAIAAAPAINRSPRSPDSPAHNSQLTTIPCDTPAATRPPSSPPGGRGSPRPPPPRLTESSGTESRGAAPPRGSRPRRSATCRQGEC